MTRAHRPVITGAAQLVEHESDPRIAMTPLEMLNRVARQAADNAGVGEKILKEIDTIGLVSVLGWYPRNAAAILGEKVGSKPASTLISATGGEIPIVLVNHVAERIEAGQTRIALIAGANNLKTILQARKENFSLDWEQGGAGEPELIGIDKHSQCNREETHGLRAPIHFYPLFENALRARRGLDVESHRLQMGRLMHRFTQVAAKNPYAWFPVERGVDELTIPSASNRMVCFPYTKYLNAIMETNQAAGILMMSAQAARELGIPEAKRVYWLGGTKTEEAPWFVSERPDFSESPSLHRCAQETFIRTGTSIGDMDFIDFYSCFPSAVEMAAEAYGVDERDPRGLTVTGGLPYAGGPANNYTLHSLATMVGLLHSRPGSTGLVTGNGMYLGKHSSVVISTEPRSLSRENSTARESSTDKSESPEIAEEASGKGTIETYTVMCNRSGAPETGVVLGRLDDGRRFVANTPSDRKFLEDFIAVEGVGREGRVKHMDGRNVFEPI